MLTRPSNEDPLYHTFYSKTGVYRGIHFHIFALKIDFGYSLEPPK